MAVTIGTTNDMGFICFSFSGFQIVFISSFSYSCVLSFLNTNAYVSVDMFVCLSVSRITQKVMNGF